jgi:hypothetical protein
MAQTFMSVGTNYDSGKEEIKKIFRDSGYQFIKEQNVPVCSAYFDTTVELLFKEGFVVSIAENSKSKIFSVLVYTVDKKRFDEIKELLGFSSWEYFRTENNSSQPDKYYSYQETNIRIIERPKEVRRKYGISIECL